MTEYKDDGAFVCLPRVLTRDIACALEGAAPCPATSPEAADQLVKDWSPYWSHVVEYGNAFLASPPTGRTLTEAVTEEELDVGRATYKAVIEDHLFSGSWTRTLWRDTWFETREQAMAARERDALRAAITAVERRVMGDVGAGDEAEIYRDEKGKS